MTTNERTLTAAQKAFLDNHKALIELAQTNEQALDGVRRLPHLKEWTELFGDMSLDEAIDRWETNTQATYDHLQAENKQLRAFVEQIKRTWEESEPLKPNENVDLYNAAAAFRFGRFGLEAIALLASLDAERE